MQTTEHRPDIIDWILQFNRVLFLSRKTERGDLSAEEFGALFRDTTSPEARIADRDALDHDLLGTPGTPTGDILFSHADTQ